MMHRAITRIAVVAVATAALAGVPFGLRATGEETDLGGYGMSATATAISFIYNQASFGLPTDPTFELRKVHSTSTTDSGPSGRALSSVVWPGDAAGNADPALILDLVMFDPTADGTPDDGGFFSPYIGDTREQIKTGIGENCKTRSCTYPVRSEAFYPASSGHPSNAMYPAGGVVEMIANAREGGADATTVTKEAGLSGAFFVGGMSSRTVTQVKKGVAIATATTHLDNVSLLGLLSFDAIDTVAEVTSDGVIAKPVTKTTITGMSIDAQCQQPGADQKTCHVPIFLDDKGLHVGTNPAQDPTGGQARKYIDQYLVPNGFNIIATRGTTNVDPEAAEGLGNVSGLIIEMNATGFNTLLDSLPDEQFGDFKAWIRSPSSKNSPLKQFFNFFSPTVAGYATSFTQGDQVMSIVLGSASVDAAAAPAYSFDEPTIDIPVIDTLLPPVAGGGDLGGGGFTGGGTTPQAPSSPTFIGALPVAVKGVPGIIGAFIVLFGALSAAALRRFADRMTTAAPADICPLEAE